eukprot:364334-Chlamydomonas_euryale.AAC.7
MHACMCTPRSGVLYARAHASHERLRSVHAHMLSAQMRDTHVHMPPARLRYVHAYAQTHTHTHTHTHTLYSLLSTLALPDAITSISSAVKSQSLQRAPYPGYPVAH